MQRPKRTPVFSLIGYAATAVLSILVLFPALRLQKADLRVPFDYVLQAPAADSNTPSLSGGGDSYFVMMLFRVMCETGSLRGTDSAGAPGGMDLRDHPIIDTLYIAIAKTLCLLTGDFAVALNLFYLLGFPLAALTCAFALRQLRVHWVLVAVISVLYALLPYHFLRGQGHLLLGHYWPIPLICISGYWLASGKRMTRRGSTGRRRLISRGWVVLSTSALLACAGAYYALFSGFLLVMAAAIRFCRGPSFRAMAFPTAAIAVWLVVLTINVLPHLIYQWRAGPNPAALVRDPQFTEYFSLKPIQLFMPVEQHRIRTFAELSGRYNSTAPLVTENRMSSLGILLSLGFVLLIANSLGLSPRTWRRKIDPLAQLNLAMLALGVIGGLGTIFAYLLSSAIRSYARVSVFTAFFAAAAFALTTHRLLARRQRALLWLTLAGFLLIVVGYLDQVSPRYVPLHEASQKEYASDRAFIQQVESALPQRAMVFQLPYVEFPEGTSPAPYELFRPYLHSTHLRWSFGAMKGRPANQLVRTVAEAASNPAAFMAALRQVGYSAILLDRALDTDRNIEQYLRKHISSLPSASQNGRLMLFVLPPESPGGGANAQH